jgi:integrase
MTEKAKKRRRARGEGSIVQRADGTWAGVIDIPSTDGRRKQKWVYSKDYRTCVAKLNKLKADVASGIVLNDTTTLGAWLDHWLNVVHRDHVRPKTFRDYQSVVEQITAIIGKRRLGTLTPEDVRKMHTALGIGRRRTVKAHAVLQRALGDAVSEGLIVRNVAAATRKPPVVTSGRAAFDEATAKTIIGFSATNRPAAEATRWAMAFLSGLRQGEVIGLEWDRVDLDGDVIDVSWQLQSLRKDHGCGTKLADGKFPCGRIKAAYCPDSVLAVPPDYEIREVYKSLYLTRPKTSAGQRFVPLIEPLADALRAIKADGPRNPYGLVFCHADGRPISPRDDHDAWVRLLVDAGVTKPGEPTPALHSARHTTATLLRAAGVDEQTRMAILGHVSVEAQRTYAHDNIELKRKAMDALAGLALG